MRSGFTLIELLIVITLIAVLSAIGIVSYSNVQKNAKDAKRRADLEAITQALEANKTELGYQTLQNSQFSSGVIPANPAGNPDTQKYCIKIYGSDTELNTDTWPLVTGSICPFKTTGPIISNTYTPIDDTTPPANTKAWRVCIQLSDGNTVECKSSTQL